MIFNRRIASLLIVSGLAGCTATNPHGVPQDSIRGYRVTGFEVRGIDVIRSWPAAEAAFVAERKPPADLIDRLRDQPAASFPEVRAFMLERMQRLFESEAKSRFAAALDGPKPARMIIELKTFDIPSAARRLLVNNTLSMQADILLVDAQSGQPLVSYVGPALLRPVLGGIAGTVLSEALIDRDKDFGQELMATYLNAYRDWLLALPR